MHSYEQCIIQVVMNNSSLVIRSDIFAWNMSGGMVTTMGSYKYLYFLYIIMVLHNFCQSRSNQTIKPIIRSCDMAQQIPSRFWRPSTIFEIGWGLLNKDLIKYLISEMNLIIYSFFGIMKVGIGHTDLLVDVLGWYGTPLRYHQIHLQIIIIILDFFISVSW